MFLASVVSGLVFFSTGQAKRLVGKNISEVL